MQSSDPIRRSIEVEYWVIDDEGRLVEPGELVDATPGAEREFVEPVLEIKTTPCETDEEVRRELLGRIEAVLDRADELDRGLVPLATPLNAGEITDLPSDRTRIQDGIIGADFEYVRHCAGTHIHVEQQPGRAVDQLNTLIALDPALALVNSSPYYRGELLSDGARSQLYRWMAYEGLAHQGRLWPYIDSVSEWDRRLERRHEEFVTAALDAGFDRSTIEANFSPESAVWTPVQLREEFDTVEWRSPDTALPSQTLTLADEIVDVVERLQHADLRIGDGPPGVSDETIRLPEFARICELVEAAIEDGLTSPAVESYLDSMGFDTGAYQPLSSQVDQQQELSTADARSLRLEYARRLDEDVRQRSPLSAD
ncbi:MAG: glutamate-cysteine ligase family protein [Halovenus sp.]